MHGYAFNGVHVVPKKRCRLVVAKECFDFYEIVHKYGLIARSHRNYMVQGQITKYSGLYLYFFCVHFPFDLVAGFQFDTAEYTCTVKHFLGLASQVCIKYLGGAGLAIKTAAFCLVHPLFAVSVAIEVYGSALDYQFAHLAQYSLS